MGKEAGTAAGNPVLWFSCVSAMFSLLGAKLLTFPESQIDGPGLWVGDLGTILGMPSSPQSCLGWGLRVEIPECREVACLSVSQGMGGGSVRGLQQADQ